MPDQFYIPVPERRAVAIWLAVGYLFIGVNLVINGVMILLPTCVGYVFLTIGYWKAAGWQTRAWRRLGKITAGLCALMVPMSFPLLFRFGFPKESWETFDRWTFFVWYLDWLLPLLTPVVLWRFFPTGIFRVTMLMVFPVTAVAWGGAHLLWDDQKLFSVLLSGGLVPLYLTGVFVWIYRRSIAARRHRPD